MMFGAISETAADRHRNQLLSAALDEWEAEDDPFTDEALNGPRSRSGPHGAEWLRRVVRDAGALSAIDRRVAAAA